MPTAGFSYPGEQVAINDEQKLIIEETAAMQKINGQRQSSKLNESQETDVNAHFKSHVSDRKTKSERHSPYSYNVNNYSNNRAGGCSQLSKKCSSPSSISSPIVQNGVAGSKNKISSYSNYETSSGSTIRNNKDDRQLYIPSSISPSSSSTSSKHSEYSSGQLTPPEGRSDEGYHSGSHDDFQKSGDSSDSECENYYVLDFR